MCWKHLQPTSFAFGSSTMRLSGPFKFEVANNGASKTLTLAFERYISLIFAHPVASSPTIGAIETISSTVVNVIVEELSDSYPQLNTDEPYT